MTVYTLNNPFNDRRGSAGAYARYKTITVLLGHAMLVDWLAGPFSLGASARGSVFPVVINYSTSVMALEQNDYAVASRERGCVSGSVFTRI